MERTGPQQPKEHTGQRSHFPRTATPVEDTTDSDGDEDCDSLREQPLLSSREPGYPANRQTVFVSIKGLQKHLSKRGVKLSTSETLVELPSNTAVTELNRALESKGKCESKSFRDHWTVNSLLRI
jgi:hypothetical protein